MKLLLASKSPRRRKLVETFNLEVVIVDIKVEEVVDPTLPADKVAETLACAKADNIDAFCLHGFGLRSEDQR